MNALANPEVGEYLNRHFVSSFQKVGTFRLVGNQKQGGNVASYFCSPDGNVLDAVAGPVDAAALLREAKWVVETRKMALLEVARRPGPRQAVLPAGPRRAFAGPARPGRGQLAGLPLMVPTEPALVGVLDNHPVARQLDRQGRIHLLLALYPLVPLDRVYKAVYEKVLNEKVSTRPVADGAAALAEPAPAWGASGLAVGDPLAAFSPAGSFSARDSLRQQRRLSPCGTPATTRRRQRFLGGPLECPSGRPGKAPAAGSADSTGAAGRPGAGAPDLAPDRDLEAPRPACCGRRQAVLAAGLAPGPALGTLGGTAGGGAGGRIPQALDQAKKGAVGTPAF